MRKIAALSIALLLTVLATCLLAQSQPDSDETHQLLRKIERSENLQTEFPELTTLSPPPVPDESFQFTLPPALVKALLWVGVVIIVLLILHQVITTYRPLSRKKLENTEFLEDIAPAPTAERMKKAQMAADELAKLGEYAEAMHTLLLQSLEELKRRQRQPIASSLTSREILFGSYLPTSGYQPFSDIVLRVEKSYFGTYVPNADEYAACCQSYDDFTAILRGM